jgi:hypothetical protein
MNEGVPDAAYRSPVRRSLPTLDDVQIAAPCSVPWDRMQGNGRVRHCRECSKQVFNISAMSRADAEVLIRERAEGVCLRFYRRFDGTILTANCPAGLRARIGAKALVSGIATALLGFLALVGLERVVTTTTKSATHVYAATAGGWCDTTKP